MARSADQLLEMPSPSKRPIIDAVLIESRLRFRSSADDEEGTVGDYCVAVVNLQNEPAAERWMLWLTASVSGMRAKRHRLVGNDCLDQFKARINEREVDFFSTVLILPEHLQRCSVEPQTVINVTREFDAMHTMAVVSDEPPAWQSLFGQTGFVRSDRGRATRVGTSLAHSFATLAAPHLLTCLDAMDIETALGTALEPSMLIEALWLPDEKRLVFLTNRGAEMLTRSPRAIAFIISSYFEQSMVAVKALREIGGVKLELDYQIAPSMVPTEPSEPVALTLLCIV